jgi:hypothetical protein
MRISPPGQNLEVLAQAKFTEKAVSRWVKEIVEGLVNEHLFRWLSY